MAIGEQADGEILETICIAAAEAVRRYAQIAVIESAWEIPEYFVVSKTLDITKFDIGKQSAKFKLEMQTTELLSYNTTHKNDSIPFIARKNIDMVVFESSATDEKCAPRILDEFKLGLGMQWLADREKLLTIMEHSDVCEWGVVCGLVWHEANAPFLLTEEEQAHRRGDLWRMKKVERLTFKNGYPEHSVCAIGFRQASTNRNTERT